MTRDQRPNVYSGHPPPISLRETPKCLSAVNWIQGLFPTSIATLRGFGASSELRKPSSLLEPREWTPWMLGCVMGVMGARVDLSAHVGLRFDRK